MKDPQTEPMHSDDDVRLEIAHMIDSNEDLFYNTIDNSELYTAIWQWYVKMESAASRRLHLKARDNAMRAYSVELFTMMDEHIKTKLDDRARSQLED